MYYLHERRIRKDGVRRRQGSCQRTALNIDADLAVAMLAACTVWK